MNRRMIAALTVAASGLLAFPSVVSAAPSGNEGNTNSGWQIVGPQPVIEYDACGGHFRFVEGDANEVVQQVRTMKNGDVIVSVRGDLTLDGFFTPDGSTDETQVFEELDIGGRGTFTTHPDGSLDAMLKGPSLLFTTTPEELATALRDIGFESSYFTNGTLRLTVLSDGTQIIRQIPNKISDICAEV